jgi:2-haloacid dehalogenase
MLDRRSPQAAPASTDGLPLVTLDLFSALIDSKTGGTHYFDNLTRRRGWEISGEEIYSTWDTINKDLQRRCNSRVPFRELSTQALGIAYRDLRLTGAAAPDTGELLESVADWPLWQDVPAGLAELRRQARVGVLSNVDDDIFARTRVAGLIDNANVLTSERLRAYKPAPKIYHAAARRAGGRYIHVATSARDIHGASSAEINTIRLRRPGHSVRVDGSHRVLEVNSLTEVAGTLSQFR